MVRKNPQSVLLALTLVLLPLSARGGTLRDGADFFSPDAEASVTQSLDRIQQRHGKNVVVETYPAPPSSVPTGGSAAARDQAFRAWIDRRGTELGADVIILVTRNPSHVEVASSKAMRSSGAFTENDHRATADLILPQFRQREFDEGILQAVQSVDRRLGQNTGPERNSGGTSAAVPRSDSSGSRSSPAYPPAPGSSNRAPAPQGSPIGACGGGMGSLLCLAVVVIGAVFIFRRMMASRAGAGGGGYSQPGYGQPGYGQPGPYGGGYGQPGYGAGGGGFGRGVMGGVLGGLLGGWLMNRGAHGGPGALGGGGVDTNAGHPPGLPPTDPSTFGDSGGGFTSSGGDFGGGAGDFGSGSDSSSGGDF